MKTIDISKKKFSNLQPLVLSNKIVNTEAVIYHFRYSSDYDGVLKKLYLSSGNVFASKLYTIEMLNYYRDILPESFVIPDALVSVRGEIVGFCMPKIIGDNLSVLLSDDKVDYKEQLFYLKCVGEEIEKLNNIRKYSCLKDIYFGDLQECNFVVDRNLKKLFAVDLDSCKISGNVAMASRYLNSKALLNSTINKYIINKDDSVLAYIIPTINSDLYCYNIMVLNYLYGDNINNLNESSFYDYLNYLRYVGIDSNLLDSFSKLMKYKDNDNISCYLDSLSSENICRAKGYVYRKVLGK